jgi:hypothetical protein
MVCQKGKKYKQPKNSKINEQKHTNETNSKNQRVKQSEYINTNTTNWINPSLVKLTHESFMLSLLPPPKKQFYFLKQIVTTHILLMKQDLIHIFPNAPKAGQPNQAR